MNQIKTAQAAGIPDIFAFLAYLLVASAVYFLIRKVLRAALAADNKPLGRFLMRLSLPAVFLLVALLFRVPSVQNAFSLSSQFDDYLYAAIVFFLFLLFIRLLDAGIFIWFQARKKSLPIPRVLHGFILFVIYIIVLFTILKRNLGFNITTVLTTSAILTAVIGLALQGVLSNVAAGISLNFTKTFNRGDWIRIGENEGVVIDTNWRETLIRDRAWNVVVFPNNFVASSTIINYSRPDTKTALTFPLKVSSSADPAEVQAAIKEAAREVPLILSDPAPLAYILSYDEKGISYLLKFWVADYNKKFSILTEIGRLVWYKFERKGISVPVPVEEQVKEILDALQEKRSETAAAEDRDRNFRDLAASTFLRRQEGERAGEMILAEADLRELAALVRRETFGKGEVLFRQGEPGESCYIVASGSVRGEIIYEESGKRYTSEFKTGPGGIFGEMSLFTGMPRTATGTIAENAELLRIGAAEFAEVLGRNPALAEAAAEIVCGRNLKNQEFLKKIKELSLKDVEDSCNKKSILDRLLRLIGRGKKG